MQVARRASAAHRHIRSDGVAAALALTAGGAPARARRKPCAGTDGFATLATMIVGAEGVRNLRTHATGAGEGVACRALGENLAPALAPPPAGLLFAGLAGSGTLRRCRPRRPLAACALRCTSLCRRRLVALLARYPAARRACAFMGVLHVMSFCPARTMEGSSWGAFLCVAPTLSAVAHLTKANLRRLTNPSRDAAEAPRPAICRDVAEAPRSAICRDVATILQHTLDYRARLTEKQARTDRGHPSAPVGE